MGAEVTTTHLEIDPVLRDGFEVHASALERGMDITLLPRQVLMVGFGNPIIGDASFVHGVPQSSSVAGVTYAQDKRVRRSLLGRYGYTVPAGATFSIGRSARAAMDFAERVGYPVVVKPAMGDNVIGALPGISNLSDMEAAIEYLHTPLEDREDFTRASYAMTELREPGVRDGVPVAPPSYRFLVEQQVEGRYVRLLIVGGTVRNALYCSHGPWKTSPGNFRDVTEEVHPELAQHAVDASKVIPGLSTVAIDLVVPDWKAPLTPSKTHIVEFSERPWLETHWKFSPDLARKLATEILRFEMRGKPVGDICETISVSVRIDGAVAPEPFNQALLRQAAKLQLNASLNVSDAALGHITGTITGAPRAIAWLMESALHDGIEGYKAMLAELRVS